MKKLNPNWSIVLKDATIKSLLRTLGGIGCVVVGLIVLYSGISFFLVPYYFVKQISYQQLKVENHLYNLSIKESDQWQSFENSMLLLSFSEDKIKVALTSLAYTYNLTVVDCTLGETKGEAFPLKAGTLILTSLLDSRIHAFLDHLKNKLSGILKIKVVKLHRSRELTEDLLKKIKTGQINDLVEATIEFEWLSF